MDLDVWRKQFDTTCVRSPKLDGSAISVQYEGGRLAVAATRGDGQVGIDITEKARFLVPEEICIAGTVQIDGEVVVPKGFANARNYAAGSLNLKDINAFRRESLKFLPIAIASPTDFIEVPNIAGELENFSKVNLGIFVTT